MKELESCILTEPRKEQDKGTNSVVCGILQKYCFVFWTNSIFREYVQPTNQHTRDFMHAFASSSASLCLCVCVCVSVCVSVSVSVCVSVSVSVSVSVHPCRGGGSGTDNKFGLRVNPWTLIRVQHRQFSVWFNLNVMWAVERQSQRCFPGVAFLLRSSVQCYIMIISRGSGADIGLPLYPRPSILGGQNLRFTPVPVITD